jgi:hypothetical protein
MSPVVHREKGYTFYVVMADLNEPPHVHIGEGRSRRSDDAKIWLDPVSVSRQGRFGGVETGQILEIVIAHRVSMLEEWNRYARRTGN